MGKRFFLLVANVFTTFPQALQEGVGLARDVVALFKAVELQDYFKDDCVDAASQRMVNLEDIARSAITIYPILLPERTELLLSLPDGLQRATVPVTAERLTQEVRVLRRLLEKVTTQEYLPHAQQLYDWLIRPIEPTLASTTIDTLVFVPARPLRVMIGPPWAWRA